MHSLSAATSIRPTPAGFPAARQAYANNLVDHHLIYDLLPSLARAYFARRLPATLSYGQAAILALLGLQQRAVEDATKELGLPTNQVLALFNKARWLAISAPIHTCRPATAPALACFPAWC